MKVRRATKKDIPDIINIWNETSLKIRNKGRDHPEALEKQLQQPNMWILVSQIQEEIVGVVLVTHDSRKGWINRLAVKPNKRRKGIGLKLLAAAEKSLEKLGIKVYSALILEENEVSKKLFEKAGYNYSQRINYFSKKENPDA
ncbi:GNAT family N-acetyltransferase [Candidatus Heimdallarchaeota archaeon]|nr:MAG: GNAT family N-acetyltransferase [Candidatus Heimdallarchaeota archaeon]